DINAVDEMWAKFNEGFDVVYGVRSKRTTDTFFKRFSAESFYKIMGIMGVDIVFNHADYRLMSQRALAALAEFHEVNLFLRGVVPMIGYPSTTVTYERAERFAGETKYPLSKMLMFAVEGVTSLSIRPIRLITVVGFLSFLASFIIMIYFIVDYIMGGTVQGWASIIVSIWAIGGLQLLAIGIIGEYIGKIYLETKARPKYVIESIVVKENE
ncbi:MAG: glycosyltransferase, partial [Defluviitaleaceae bacterium]|nr:glycosyltransferase [Defluviitaleaceae bacterium]